MQKAARAAELIILGSVLVTLTIACTRTAADEGLGEGQAPAYGLVSPIQVERIIRANWDNPEFVLLDIRTPDEIASGHIASTQMLDYYSEGFRDELARLDQEKTYLIYCRTGNRTGRTMSIMADLGFEKVYDLDGGITAWTTEGFAICLGPLDGSHNCLPDLGMANP